MPPDPLEGMLLRNMQCEHRAQFPTSRLLHSKQPLTKNPNDNPALISRRFPHDYSYAYAYALCLSYKWEPGLRQCDGCPDVHAWGLMAALWRLPVMGACYDLREASECRAVVKWI